MALDTVILQGRFTSDGAAKTLQIRSDIDFMWVYNETNAGATGDDSVKFYWQRGMADATGIRYFKSGGGNALNLTTLASPNGFQLIDQSAVTVTVSPNAVTNISAAATPRVTSTAHGVLTGDIVRIVNATGAAQLGAIDFRATRVDADNIDLTYMAQIVAAAAPGANARIVKISREELYVPRNRVITAVTAANPAVVTLAAPHSFTVGQRVKFQVPQVTTVAYGMTELNGLEANVTAVSVANNTITVDIDSLGFTAFAFPLTADAPFTPAQVIPVGEDTATALSNSVDILGDAVNNTGILGMLLPGGADAPGGGNNDVMYWVAGKSFSVDNE